MSRLSEKDKSRYVSGKFLVCIKGFPPFEKGRSYWLEYVGHDTYCGRSDNILNKKIRITPDELMDNFGERVVGR